MDYNINKCIIICSQILFIHIDKDILFPTYLHIIELGRNAGWNPKRHEDTLTTVKLSHQQAYSTQDQHLASVQRI